MDEGILEEDSTTFFGLETPSNSGSDEDTSNNLITRPINRHISETFDAWVVKNPAQPLSDSPRGMEEDTISYPFPKYDELDAKAHIREDPARSIDFRMHSAGSRTSSSGEQWQYQRRHSRGELDHFFHLREP